MFHADLTGPCCPRSDCACDVSVPVARRGHTGLWFVFCLSYLRLGRVNVKRNREGKMVFSFQGRCINAKEISALDRVRITFLENKGTSELLHFILEKR